MCVCVCARACVPACVCACVCVCVCVHATVLAINKQRISCECFLSFEKCRVICKDEVIIRVTDKIAISERKLSHWRPSSFGLNYEPRSRQT